MSWSKSFIAAICGLAVLGVGAVSDRALADDHKGAPMPASFYALSTSRLNGEPVDLKEYAGKVALVVNTASKCGFTPQYKGLQELYTDLSPRGFVILGFPSNDFRRTGAGNGRGDQDVLRAELQGHLPDVYKGSDQSRAGPVADLRMAGAERQPPAWNFSKYVIGKDGHIVAFFPSKVTPDAPELRAAIESALK
jgi:glutathione peroxidase